VTTQGDRGGDRDGRADRDRRGRYFPLRAQGEQRRHSGKLNMSAKRKATAIMQHHKVSTAMYIRTRARTLACMHACMRARAGIRVRHVMRPLYRLPVNAVPNRTFRKIDGRFPAADTGISPGRESSRVIEIEHSVS